MEKQLTIGVEDLQAISLECGKCHCVVTLPLKRLSPPVECPSCLERFSEASSRLAPPDDTQVRAVFRSIEGALSAIQSLRPHAIRFHVQDQQGEK